MRALTALRESTTPVGYWCAGGHHDRIRLLGREIGDDEAVLVDAYGYGLEADADDRAPLPAPAGVLDGDTAGAPAPQCGQHREQAVRDPAGDDHLVGLSHDGAGPAQVRGDGDAQFGRPTVWGVGQARVGQFAQRPGQGALPAAPGEGVKVCLSGAQVIAKGGEVPRLTRAGQDPGRGECRDARAGTPLGRQVALGHELRVAVHHDAA